jgi:hypothetical protein
LRRTTQRALTSSVPSEATTSGQSEKVKRLVVTYAFSRNPRDDFVEWIREVAEHDDRIRLAVSLREDSHRYRAFLILYVTTRKEGHDLAHDLLGTQVAHENNKGPRGLKTI